MSRISPQLSLYACPHVIYTVHYFTEDEINSAASVLPMNMDFQAALSPAWLSMTTSCDPCKTRLTRPDRKYLQWVSASLRNEKTPKTVHSPPFSSTCG